MHAHLRNKMMILILYHLLDDDPVPVLGEHEAVVVELVPVLDEAVIDLGGHPAGVYEAVYLPAAEAEDLPHLPYLLRRPEAGPAFAAAHRDAHVLPVHGLLEGAAGHGGGAAAVPVVAQDTAKALEEPGVAQPL